MVQFILIQMLKQTTEIPEPLKQRINKLAQTLPQAPEQRHKVLSRYSKIKGYEFLNQHSKLYKYFNHRCAIAADQRASQFAMENQVKVAMEGGLEELSVGALCQLVRDHLGKGAEMYEPLSGDRFQPEFVFQRDEELFTKTVDLLHNIALTRLEQKLESSSQLPQPSDRPADKLSQFRKEMTIKQDGSLGAWGGKKYQGLGSQNVHRKLFATREKHELLPGLACAAQEAMIYNSLYISTGIEMGNQPNNLIQCGQDQKDYKQETFTTREQAIRQNKGQHIFKQQPPQSKTSTTIIGSQNSQPSTPASQSSLPKPPSRLASRNAFPSIPEHQNLTRVSKTPKNLYLIVGNGELYEEERGKCLDEIIESRYNTTMHFPDYQIHGLLECLVYSLAYMVRKNIPHHDFYPTNIFYNNGVFKLLNPMLIKNSAYSLTQQRKRFSFLSPELILEVLNDTPYQSISKDVINKSDVFAIGMILLEFCTLTPSSECYDPETYSIVDSIINERVEKTRSLYNPLIADCIDLMLQYEVDKRIPPIELAYAVHAKVREVKTDEEQMSRVQQMSRMTMSGKPPMIPQPHVMPPQPQGIPPERVLVQAPPPGFLGQDPTQVTPNAQPYLVSGNPKTMPPSSNLPSFPYFNPNVLPPNMSSYPNIRNIPGAQVNPAINPMIPQQRLPPQPAGYPKTDFELSGGYRKPQNSYFVTSENKPQEPKFNYPEPPRPESSNLPKPSLLPTSNTKLKLNPFEQIQEDLKEDEDESPQKYKINVNTLAGQTRPQEFSTTFPASPSANSSPKQYKFKSSEYAAMYNLKSPTNPTSTATTTTTGTTSGFGYSSNKEQTLDQRVRRILEASKHIK